MPEKTVLLRTSSRADPAQNYVSSNKNPFVFDIVIMVNGKTASSCEIIVGSLQDNKKALIIGTKTFGKGVFEKTFTLENEFRVKFISGTMHTPRNRPWQSTGIVPDFAVKQDAKTFTALRKLTPSERLRKDVYLITGHKLLNK